MGVSTGIGVRVQLSLRSLGCGVVFAGIYWPQRCVTSGPLCGKIVLYAEFLNECTPLAAYTER